MGHARGGQGFGDPFAQHPSGAQQGAAVGLLPQRLQFSQELIELGGSQPHQPLEGTRSGLQLLQPQHP